MLEIRGKYCNDIKVFTDNVEGAALDLIKTLSDSIPYEGKKIRIMPDCHLGKGAVIGFSCPIDIERDMLSPATVGVDIGCTVSAAFYNAPIPSDKIAEIEHKIRKDVPFGFDTHEHSQITVEEIVSAFSAVQHRLISACPSLAPYAIPFKTEKDLTMWLKRLNMDFGRFMKSIGTVGGGNHFLEFDANEEEGKYAVVVHCGSRNLGQKVCGYWTKIAESNKPSKGEWKTICETVKSQTQDRKKIKEALAKALQEFQSKHVNGYLLNGDQLYGYLIDMLLCQEYAHLNHQVIHGIVERHLKKYGLKQVDFISTTHNYIDFDLTASSGRQFMCTRKGAIRAYSGEKCLIPFNMRDGIAVCEGKSNEDWNYTAPHGCGRLYSRNKAKETLTLEDFQSTMAAAGVYTTTADATTLDEAPMAYKPFQEILRLIEPTVHVLYLMKPIFNIKSA